MDQVLLTIREVSEVLGLHPNTIRNLMERGELPFIKIGKSLRFHTEDVQAFIERARVETGG
jgi:excisionase family DNA binding protein